MSETAQWIQGSSRSGKTTRLQKKFCDWLEKNEKKQKLMPQSLVFAANDDNRKVLADKLAIAVGGRYPILCKTFLGFISEEISLFWPILFEKLGLNAQFPLRLRPETEQDLATQLWRPSLEKDWLSLNEVSKSRFVRQTLDLLQLAGTSGLPVEEIPVLLREGLPEVGLGAETEEIIALRGKLIIEWQNWCLERGLLSYGLIYTLYWRDLLPDVKYQRYLQERYQGIFADDLDDYPAIFVQLANLLLNTGANGVFTFNPQGQIRLGLGADATAVSQLANRCEIIQLEATGGLARELVDIIVPLALNPLNIVSLPPFVQSLQTPLRSELLRQTAAYIIEAVEKKQIKPEEIAIISPGLDEIARYSLMEIIAASGIAITALNEQRPLISSPLVRALLTLLGLVYSGLGRWVLKDEVAEMLVILSQKAIIEQNFIGKRLIPDIDPVRAGLIVDYCYHIDPENPRLLPLESFSRRDRLGYRATEAYRRICQWIEETQAKISQQPSPSPLMVLHGAMNELIDFNSSLSYDQASALRELMETCQHYWEISKRVQLYQKKADFVQMNLKEFLQLLKRGTITANPRPVQSFGQKEEAVTLATIFQYRSLRRSHKWHFWLDIASPLWEKGGSAVLLGAPIFLKDWSGRPISLEDEVEADKARLSRLLEDLLARVEEKLIFCHSDLNVRGTEQTGPLLMLL